MLGFQNCFSNFPARGRQHGSNEHNQVDKPQSFKDTATWNQLIRR